MTAALQTEPLAGTVSEGDEMVKFAGANLDAWRSRTSHALHVDISVGLTACAKIEVKECVYPSQVEADDVLATLATWGRNESIPVVVVTVLSREECLGSESEAATAFWVNKPFDANNLIQTVQDVLASVAQEGRHT